MRFRAFVKYRSGRWRFRFHWIEQAYDNYEMAERCYWYVLAGKLPEGPIQWAVCPPSQLPRSYSEYLHVDVVRYFAFCIR